MKTVGVIGLGNMGRGMALSLKRGGYTVLGFDAAPGVAGKLDAEGVSAARVHCRHHARFGRPHSFAAYIGDCGRGRAGPGRRGGKRQARPDRRRYHHRRAQQHAQGRGRAG